MHWYNAALARTLAQVRPIPTLPSGVFPVAQPGDYLLTVAHSGMARTALLHLPPAITDRRPLPLVLLLHGKGSNALHFSHLTAMNPVADQAGCIVLYPQGTDRTGGRDFAWNAGWCCGTPLARLTDDTGFIRRLLAGLQAAYPIEPRMVYAGGHSNGAILCYHLATALWPAMAAIAPVAGAMRGDETLPAGPVSLLAVHGTADRAVRYHGYGPPAHPVYQPLATTVARWVAHNGCETTPEVVENATSRHDHYPGGQGGSAVEVITFKNGTHAWPSARWVAGLNERPAGPPSLAALLWHFFAAHPRTD